MGEAPPRVSVAVSTYNRAGSLPRLLAALERQTLTPEDFEVVVADNGSTDATPQVLADLGERTTLRLRVVRLEPNRGPARGRNAAWRAARAPVVAFTDDDCLPQPPWLERGLVAIEEGADVVAGRTEPNPDELDRLGPFARTVWPDFARFFPTCNVFYRRSDLERVGGFDESFVGTGGEDTDLAWRLIRLGRRVAFADEALVYHEVKPGSFRDKVRETLRWSDLPRVVAKHPAMRRTYLVRRVFWKRSHPRVIMALAGMALAPVLSPATLVLILPWLKLRSSHLPPSHRVATLAGLFVIDALEVAVMVRGSIRHRTVLL